MSLERAVATYMAAGSLQAEATATVVGMIVSLSAEHGDWLWGSAQAWRDRHRVGKPDPQDHADLFEPGEYGEGWDRHSWQGVAEAGSAIPR